MTALAGWCRFAVAAATASLFLTAARALAAEPADAVRYPYVAALSRTSDAGRVYFCAGALVAPRWILTAAHCFHSRSGVRIATRDLWAMVGRDRLGNAEETAQVGIDRIVLLPGYDPSSQENDLALVRLADIAGPLIAEAAGPADDPAQATALGFGSFYEGRLAGRALSSKGQPTAQASNSLRRSRLLLVMGAECWRYGGSRDMGMAVCATASPDEACVGDSGGPLIVEAAEGADRLLGVLSVGSGCAVAEPRLGYTRVAPYAGWIAETIAAD